jgi:hypothetical protein
VTTTDQIAKYFQRLSQMRACSVSIDEYSTILVSEKRRPFRRFEYVLTEQRMKCDYNAGTLYTADHENRSGLAHQSLSFFA